MEAEDLITFVGDRAGHDARRALDSGKAEREIGFRPEVEFAQGLEDTVRHFLAKR
jgi:dTDP-glucose 4,6-dehydratase